MSATNKSTYGKHWRQPILSDVASAAEMTCSIQTCSDKTNLLVLQSNTNIRLLSAAECETLTAGVSAVVWVS